jgi:hypothetical protein
MSFVKIESAASMHPALLSIMTLTSQADVSTPKTLVGPVLQASSVVKLYAFVPSHFDGDCCVKMTPLFVELIWGVKSLAVKGISAESFWRYA